MLTGGGLLALLGALLAIAAALVAFAVVRHAPRAAGGESLGRGDFTAALRQADTGPQAGREELFAAAVAAKHLLELERAAGLLDRILAEDPGDGEAALERGLVAAYAGEHAAAAAWLDRAAARRADLAESLLLHRAWLALAAGDRGRARRLFEEVEAPLETKLRLDLGPGDPAFADWFFHAGELWLELGDPDRGRWALREARRSAPGSRLFGAGDPPAL